MISILFVFFAILSWPSLSYSITQEKNEFLQKCAFSGNDANDARKNIRKYIVSDVSVFENFDYLDMQTLAKAFSYRWNVSYRVTGCHFQERGYFDKTNIEEPKKWYDLVEQYQKNFRKFEGAIESRDLTELQILVRREIVFEMKIYNALSKSKNLERDYAFFIEAGINQESLAIILEDLHWCKAIRNGNIEKVRELIARGYFLNKSTCFTRPPLIIATICQNIEIMRVLLAAGSNVNLKLLGSHETPLMIAAADWDDTLSQKKIKQVIETLIDHGADINAQDATGATALMKAMEANNKIAFEMLLEYRADYRMRNNEGLTVKEQIAKKIKKYGTDSYASRSEYLDILRKYK